MDNEKPNVSICLCTYKRPVLLERCLTSLLALKTSRRFEIVIADNDAKGSAYAVVDKFKKNKSDGIVNVKYSIESEQNIALARNRAYAMADTSYIAWIDDDETVKDDWLDRLCDTIEKTGADGVFYPVIPVFSDSFPKWMKKSRLFQRARFSTGTRVHSHLLTHNLIIKKNMLELRTGPYDAQFGRTGGEDIDLFIWLEKKGALLCWCDEAIAYGAPAEESISWLWHLRRGYRGGWFYSNTCVIQKGLMKGILFSFARIIPALTRNIFQFVLDIHNPKAALLIFLRSISGHLGKIGFFLGIKIEEYKQK